MYIYSEYKIYGVYDILNIKDSTRRFLQLIRTFSKVAGYKTNTKQPSNL